LNGVHKIGSLGTGKSMLAKGLPMILPPLTPFSSWAQPTATGSRLLGSSASPIEALDTAHRRDRR
jgi:hypothetical protein